MQDYYDTLGLNSSATLKEIRRAYRILARRYHPDVNPGNKSGEKFKEIAEAYKILSDSEQKNQYDLEYEKAHQKLAQARLKSYADQARAKLDAQTKAFRDQSKSHSPKSTRAATKSKSSIAKDVKSKAQEVLSSPLSFKFPKISIPFFGKKNKESKKEVSLGSISLIEVSLTVTNAIIGIKKTIEINDSKGMRKISVTIPPGVRTGSIVRMRSKHIPGEELVLIIHLAHHPYLSIEKKGLVVDLPVTVSEALLGAKIQVPTLNDSQILNVPAGSQSGNVLRLKDMGIMDREGRKGDLFYRLMVTLPSSQTAVGIKEKVQALQEYYSVQVREKLPSNLLKTE